MAQQTDQAGNEAPRKASEIVADEIRARIAKGEVEPGDSLPSETVLMEEFGVARPTMREAIRILESDGLIRVQRGVGGGARVQPFDIDKLAKRVGLYLQTQGADFSDLTEVQDILEPGAAGLAATRRSEQDLGAMRLCVEMTARCTTAEDLARVATEFHLLLLRASGNRTLSLISKMLQQLLQIEYTARAETMTAASLPRIIEQTVTWYGQLVDLIEANDADGAVAHWTQHQLWSRGLRGKRTTGRRALQVFS